MLDFCDQRRAEETSFHEAGHAVAGLELGLRVRRVVIREDCSGTCEWLPCDSTMTLTTYRRRLGAVAAGPVGGLLLEESLEGPSDRRDPPEDSLAYRLLSHRIRDGRFGDDEVDLRHGLSDARVAFSLAREICLIRQFKERGMSIETLHCVKMRLVLNKKKPLPVDGDELLGEVVRAERRAERLLRRRWAAVRAVAHALEVSRSGQLTGKRVMKLVREAS
jgi:hypothetical protein